MLLTPRLEDPQRPSRPRSRRRSKSMERRTFLLGLIGGLATASLTPAVAAPSLEPPTPSEGAGVPELSADNAEIRADNLDGVDTEHAQYYRRRARRVYRRYY